MLRVLVEEGSLISFLSISANAIRVRKVRFSDPLRDSGPLDFNGVRLSSAFAPVKNMSDHLVIGKELAELTENYHLNRNVITEEG